MTSERKGLITRGIECNRKMVKRERERESYAIENRNWKQRKEKGKEGRME